MDSKDRGIVTDRRSGSDRRVEDRREDQVPFNHPDRRSGRDRRRGDRRESADHRDPS